MSKQLAVSKHLFMHHGEISDGGGDGYPEVETETEVEEEVEVMEMKMIWILLLGGLSKPDLAEKNGPAGETDGGRKGGGKAVPTLKASCTSTMAPFTVGTRARKTGEKVREKRVGVWSFCGAFLFEKRYKSKQFS